MLAREGERASYELAMPAARLTRRLHELGKKEGREGGREEGSSKRASERVEAAS